jgi:hypothetical protein
MRGGRMTFDRLWTWIALALPLLVALLVPLPAVDLAYQVRAGNEILASGAIPHADSWTFTIYGAAWTDQQWLAQVILAAVHRAGGWELLVVLRALLVAATTGLLVAAARWRGASPRTAAVLALIAFAVAAPALALRPQLFGITLFAALLWLVAGRAQRPRLLVVGAPIVVAMWANLHGSFVLAPVILGWAWLDDVVARRPARASIWGLVLGTGATLVNPFTVGAWLYAAGIGANPVIAQQVSEWQRTSPFEMPGLVFYPAAAVVAVLVARRGRAIGWPSWLLLAAMTAIGAWAVRGVAWWAMAAVPLAAGALAGADAAPVSAAPSAAVAPIAARPRRGTVLNGVTAVLLGAVIVLALPWWRPADPLTGRAGILSYAPSALAGNLRALVEGNGQAIGGGTRPARVVVPQTWGSWFEWAVPDAAYFIDSRFELFPPDVWGDLAAFARGDEAGVLDRWQVDVVVVAAGERAPGGAWDVAYRDVEGAILVRRR